MRLDKKKVLKAFIKAQENKIQNLKNSLEMTRQHVIDAPGSNVSHSDTSKFQLSNVALGLDRQILEAKESLFYLRNIPIHQDPAIRVGSFIRLKERVSDSTTIYFLVDRGGGETVRVDELSVATLNIVTPLGRACLGKNDGDEVPYNKRVYVIENL